MFEKNLNDLVRGIRNNKGSEAKYVAQCLDDIKQELRQENMAIKANAVSKLIYLQMIGYDISWAAFNIIEVMSSVKFTHKRIGYLAASQSFHEELDVLMLTTNLIKKDMAGQSQYDAGVAMSGLSCFITPDLARDLANDIMNHMVSTRGYMRKKAILLMYKVFLNFPEALRPAFPRLKEKLEDPDPGVQCAAVNVICELARKNPRNYLSLAPLFFKLMTTSSNNWMLIKIIKLMEIVLKNGQGQFGALCPLEPRLGKKLMEPLTNLIHSTSAMSLLYECIQTVIQGLPDHMPSIQLCVSKLRLLIEDPDQNLKYLGLLALNKILKKHPKAIHPHRDLILQCLDDKDESIRYRALDLIAGMISKKTLVDIIRKLLAHMEKSEGSAYRDELLSKVIEICSQSNYQYITNFEWYVDVLIRLSQVESTKFGKVIASQMLDVTIRVKAVRPYAVPTFSQLLDRAQLYSGGAQKNSPCEVLYAAAWVAGEFSEHLSDLQTPLTAMLHPRVTTLPGHIQGIFVQNVVKLFSRILIKANSEDEEEIDTLGKMLQEKLQMFTQSSDLEVQDRACCILQLINYILKMREKGVPCGTDIASLFNEELVPVAPKAQKKVPVPEGLNLDKWINEPPSESSSEEEEQTAFFTDEKIGDSYQESQPTIELDEAELEKRREARRQMQATNPHYLKMDTPKKDDTGIAVDDIPVAKLDLPVPLRVEKEKGKKKKRKRRKGKQKVKTAKDHGNKLRSKGKEESESEEEPSHPHYEVMTVEGGESHDDEEDGADLSKDDPHRLLNIDLDKPLESHETLPVRQHRLVESKKEDETTKGDEKEVSKEPKKSKKKKHEKEKEAKKKRRKSEGEEVKKHESKEKKHKTSKKEAKPKKKASKEETNKAPSAKLKRDESPQPQKTPLLKLASAYEKKPETKDKEMSGKGGKRNGLDDMDFWLSPTDASVEQPKASTPQTEPAAKGKESTANAVSPNSTNSIDKDENKLPEKPKKKSREKSDKGKGKKSKKKTKKTEESKMDEEETKTDGPMIMDADDIKVDVHAHYKILGENKKLQLKYDVKVDPLQRNQAIVSIIFKNLTENQMISLEFNVLDSLNMKLIRHIGDSSHDPIKVPFQLPPGAVNEGQFAFTVDSIVMVQWLRGTLTYILKTPEGSTMEKIDFKITFPVSAFILPSLIKRSEFASLLAGGDLNEKQSVKVTVPEDEEFEKIIQRLCRGLHLIAAKSPSSGQSRNLRKEEKTCCEPHFNAFSGSPDRVQRWRRGKYDIISYECWLNEIQEKGSNCISVDAKSTNYQLLTSILNQIKDIMNS